MSRDRGLKPGQRFADKYQILGRLGRGSAGVVYRALQENVRREVALKLLSVELAERTDMVERFRREAFHVSQLQHPHTVTLFDYGSTDTHHFIAMELLQGKTLGRLLRRQGGLNPARATRILLQVLRSLNEAHEKGIVHRDLKPDNIFLAEIAGESDFVKVLDFGIAKALETQDAQLTEHGMVFGTPSYMAPEQAMGGDVSAATDVYAMGLIYYEMLAGQMAFQADSMYALLNMQVTEPLPRLGGELTSGPYNNILQVATAKKPIERYQHAGEFLEALENSFESHRDNWLAPVEAAYRSTEILEAFVPEEDDADERTELLGNLSANKIDEADIPTVVPGRVSEPDEPTIYDAARSTAMGREALKMVFEPCFEPAEEVWPAPTGEVFGRQRELGLLTDAALDMQSGEGGGLGLIYGAVGVGKSTLAQILTRGLQGRGEVLTVLVSATDDTQGVPWGGLLTAVRRLNSERLDPDGLVAQVCDRWVHEQLGHGHPLFGFFTQLLDEYRGLPDGARLGPEEAALAFEALIHLMATLTSVQPILILVDDAHDVDEWSLHLLHHMAQSGVLSQAPLGIWLWLDDAVCDPQVGQALGQLAQGLDVGPRMELEPLSVSAHRAWMSSLAPIAEQAVTALYKLSGGNPGVALESFEAFCRQGQLRWSQGRWGCEGDLQAPASVLNSRLERLERLESPSTEVGKVARVLLQWVAVLGPHVSIDALRDASRRDPRLVRMGARLDDIRQRLIERGVLEVLDGSMVRLRDQALVAHFKGAMDQGMQPEKLHAVAYELKKGMAWGDAAERDFHLGLHLSKTERPRRAWEHLLDAADLAHRSGDLWLARRAYESVDGLWGSLGIARTKPRPMVARASCVEVLLRLGEHKLASEHLEELAQWAKEGPDHVRLRDRVKILEGVVEYMRGRLEPAVMRLKDLLESDFLVTPTPFSAELVWVLGRLARALKVKPLFEQCREHLKRMSASIDRPVRARGLLSMGLMHWLEGDELLARRGLEDCLAMHHEQPRSWPRAVALLALGRLSIASESWSEAQAQLDEALLVADRLGARPLMVEAWCARARLQMLTEAAGAAEGDLRLAWEHAQALEMPLPMADVLITTAGWMASLGQDGAAMRLEQGQRLLEAMGHDSEADPRWRGMIALTEALMRR